MTSGPLGLDQPLRSTASTMSVQFWCMKDGKANSTFCSALYTLKKQNKLHLLLKIFLGKYLCHIERPAKGLLLHPAMRSTSGERSSCLSLRKRSCKGSEVLDETTPHNRVTVRVHPMPFLCQARDGWQITGNRCGYSRKDMKHRCHTHHSDITIIAYENEKTFNSRHTAAKVFSTRGPGSDHTRPSRPRFVTAIDFIERLTSQQHVVRCSYTYL